MVSVTEGNNSFWTHSDYFEQYYLRKHCKIGIGTFKREFNLVCSMTPKKFLLL